MGLINSIGNMFEETWNNFKNFVKGEEPANNTIAGIASDIIKGKPNENINKVAKSRFMNSVISKGQEKAEENEIAQKMKEIADDQMKNSETTKLNGGVTIGEQDLKNTDEKTDGNTIDFKEIIDDARKYSEEQQQKLWDREDKIRAETQAREDSAYSRAVNDMRKAGINPNLINISPAQSGGGITQASKSQETTANEVNGAYNMIINAINNDKDIQENTRDRLNTLISSALHAYLMFKFMK